MSWWTPPFLWSNHVERRPYTEIEKAILIDNAKGPNRVSALQLQWYFFYKLNSFRTAQAITRKTQKLLKEINVQPAIAFADQDHGGDSDEAASDHADDRESIHHEHDCPICLQPSAQGTFALQCRDSFCMPCLRQWAAQDHDTCPLCRTHMLPEIKMQLLHGVSMRDTFDLGRRLATSDMEALGQHMRLLMQSLHTNAQLHPLSTLLSETSRFVLHSIGLDASDLTFKPYLDHMATHSQTPRSPGERITALCAINANGLHIQHTAVEADACSKIRSELEEARFCNTCALWLDQNGVELPPKVLAHETMLKPDDCWQVKKRQKECMKAFLSEDEAGVHFRAIYDRGTLILSVCCAGTGWRTRAALQLASLTHPSFPSC